VNRLASELGITEAVQVVSVPSWLEAVTAVRDRNGFLIVYDCHDFLPGFERMSKQVIAAEVDLLKSADHVVFSAQYLLDLVVNCAADVGPKAMLLRNASRHTNFRPQPMRSLKFNSVAYVGSLDHWFDRDFVAAAAEWNPGLTFKLAGRIEDMRIRSLQAYKNIRFYDEIPYSSVPDFLDSCDAAMIPFCRSALTFATNPIKLYEYFSAGLPVVSSRLPEVELYGDLVYIADTPQQFASSIAQAVRESSPSARQQRLARGQSETWGHRAMVLSNRFGSSEERRRPDGPNVAKKIAMPEVRTHAAESTRPRPAP
jgi:glycosyltransferase involved in cell wall biosynthesis